jgi:TetR/AcrR family transcriptional regulator, transcriptional repressor for nem operon
MRRDPHRNRVRDRIVRSAAALFNRRGFTSVSIDEIMGGAGLTRGGFYSYFGSKGELYAAAVDLLVHEKRQGASEGAMDRAIQTVRDYLSVRHHDDPEAECPLIGLPNDLSRNERSVREAQECALRLLVDTFQSGARDGTEERRERALALVSLCVGGMVLAQAIEDRALADELRDASRRIAMRLGGWDEPALV